MIAKLSAPNTLNGAGVLEDPTLVFATMDDSVSKMFSSAVWKKFLGFFGSSLTSAMVGVFMLIPIGYGMWKYFINLARAVIMYLISVMGMGVLLMVAPIFISFLLFKYTKEMFDSWLKMLISFMFQPIFIFMCLNIFSYILLFCFYAILDFGVCKTCWLRLSDLIFLIPFYSSSWDMCLIDGYSMMDPSSSALFTKIGAIFAFVIIAISLEEFINFSAQFANTLATGMFVGMNLASTVPQSLLSPITSFLGMDQHSRQNRMAARQNMAERGDVGSMIPDVIKSKGQIAQNLAQALKGIDSLDIDTESKENKKTEIVEKYLKKGLSFSGAAFGSISYNDFFSYGDQKGSFKSMYEEALDAGVNKKSLNDAATNLAEKTMIDILTKSINMEDKEVYLNSIYDTMMSLDGIDKDKFSKTTLNISEEYMKHIRDSSYLSSPDQHMEDLKNIYNITLGLDGIDKDTFKNNTVAMSQNMMRDARTMEDIQKIYQVFNELEGIDKKTLGEIATDLGKEAVNNAKDDTLVKTYNTFSKLDGINQEELNQATIQNIAERMNNSDSTKELNELYSELSNGTDNLENSNNEIEASSNNEDTPNNQETTAKVNDEQSLDTNTDRTQVNEELYTAEEENADSSENLHNETEATTNNEDTPNNQKATDELKDDKSLNTDTDRTQMNGELNIAEEENVDSSKNLHNETEATSNNEDTPNNQETTVEVNDEQSLDTNTDRVQMNEELYTAEEENVDSSENLNNEIEATTNNGDTPNNQKATDELKDDKSLNTDTDRTQMNEELYTAEEENTDSSENLHNETEAISNNEETQNNQEATDELKDDKSLNTDTDRTQMNEELYTAEEENTDSSENLHNETEAISNNEETQNNQEATVENIAERMNKTNSTKELDELYREMTNSTDNSNNSVNRSNNIDSDALKQIYDQNIERLNKEE